MKIFIVMTYCEYDPTDRYIDEAFSTRELAETYIADWDYRKNYTIKKVELRDSYTPTSNLA